MSADWCGPTALTADQAADSGVAAIVVPKNLSKYLDLTTLELVVSIAEEGTLTAGARRVSMTPSAASKRLVDLEEAIGMPIFTRQARGMVSTSAGQTLMLHARRVLHGVEKIADELDEHAHGVRGHVRMVANLSAIVEFLPEDLRDFLLSNGDVRLDLEERPSPGVIAGVEERWADIGICSSDVDSHALHSEPYRRDTLVLVMRSDHELADRTSVSFDETLNMDHIGLHFESSINRRTHLAALHAGKSLKLRIRVPGFDGVCRMAQVGMGVGVIPRRVYDAMGVPLGLACVPLSDQWAQRQLQIVVRDLESLSPATMALLSHLTSSAAAADAATGTEGAGSATALTLRLA